MIIQKLNEILDKVMTSRMALSDKIHDGKKGASTGKEIKYFEAKYNFWKEAESKLRECITYVENSWDRNMKELE